MRGKQHFLLIAFGSYGDVYPFFVLAKVLTSQGHSVSFATIPQYRQLLEHLGIRFLPMDAGGLWEAYCADRKAWDTSYGLHCFFRKFLGPMVRPVYRLVSDVVHQERQVLVIASVLALGARIAYDSQPFRLLTANPYPIFFPSRRRPPVMPRYKRYDVGSGRVPLFPHALVNWLDEELFGPPERNPRIVFKKDAPPWRKWLAQVLSDRVLDRLLWPFVAGLALPGCRLPRRRLFAEYAFSPEMTLGLFPDWFAPAQPDWPPHVALSTFPELGALRRPPSDRLEAFLAAGPPPVVFTFGSHKRHSADLFATALATVKRTGQRAVLLTQSDQDIPNDLPPQVLHARFEPLPYLLRRASLVVHHAGIGTCADALRAGIPQILVPFTYDQPDNATRLVRLGVGRIVPVGLLTPDRLARDMEAALAAPDVARACQDLAARLAAEDSDGLLLEKVLEWVERQPGEQAQGR